MPIFWLKSYRDPGKTDSWPISLEFSFILSREAILLPLAEMKQYHKSFIESIITLSVFPPSLELSHRCGEPAVISPGHSVTAWRFFLDNNGA